MSISHFIRGFLMGIADSIPGISGGTIAMIVGIYERLVSAISQCDGTAIRFLLTGKWRSLAKRIDLGFLGTLVAGIGVGILSSLLLVLYLLENHLPETFAAFMGLILGSAWILFQKIRAKTLWTCIALVFGTVTAWYIVSLQAISGSEHLGYVFLCGVIAISAMILPGISGSYILLILGEYPIVTGKIKAILHGNVTWDNFVIPVVFACGCALGLVAFSKVLKWLLAHFHSTVMAILCGFMLGSLKCLYPFQRMVDQKTFEQISLRTVTPGQWLAVVVFMIAGLVLIGVLHQISQRFHKH